MDHRYKTTIFSIFSAFVNIAFINFFYYKCIISLFICTGAVMFGYVVANKEKLSTQDAETFRGFYCALCHSLQSRHGLCARMTLNFDMSFLAIMLSCVYNVSTEDSRRRCFIHPIKPHLSCHNHFVDYAADINIMLSYYKFLDDWHDEHKPHSRAAAAIFSSAIPQLQHKYPRISSTIQQELAALSHCEQHDEINPDIPAACFGRLMAEIFVPQEDELAPTLRAFGDSLGRFIYIMDACIDLKDDLRHERYNPLRTYPSDFIEPALELLMADCIKAYQNLPHYCHQTLLENILYSGIWSKYAAKQAKSKEKNTQ